MSLVDIPKDIPVAFTPAFIEDGTKEIQWQAFLQRSSISGFELTLSDVLFDLKTKILPILQRINS